MKVQELKVFQENESNYNENFPGGNRGSTKEFRIFK